MATISETLPNSEAVSHAYKFASTWEKVGFLASLRVGWVCGPVVALVDLVDLI
jgi:hypothetical protein